MADSHGLADIRSALERIGEGRTAVHPRYTRWRTDAATQLIDRALLRAIRTDSCLTAAEAGVAVETARQFLQHTALTSGAHVRLVSRWVPLRILRGVIAVQCAACRRSRIMCDEHRCRRRCVRCGHSPMRISNHGFCDACVSNTTSDVRLDYPDVCEFRSGSDVFDDWLLLRARNYTRRRAAERLGMTHAAFAAAVRREARRRGVTCPRSYGYDE